MIVDAPIALPQLQNSLDQLWQVAGRSIASIDATYCTRDETPVLTVDGRYVPQGWTEWTQGFQFGCGFLHFDATADQNSLAIAQRGTLDRMATHLSHFGVHDHGFNNVSTYGHLRRLALDGRVDGGDLLVRYCELALKVSGAVQAARWCKTHEGSGYIYSFNGPQSLFSDTIRSLRSLAIAHRLQHVLWGENDVRVSLFDRLCQHVFTTAKYNVYYGEGRDLYDVAGRVVHESLFNPNDGRYRCPSTQQGYSPFSTWTRGLAWVILGLAEQLEFLTVVADDLIEATQSNPLFPGQSVRDVMLQAARVTSEFYLAHSSRDGIPFWDTGAPGIAHLPNYRAEIADPYNPYEPVDSSAAAIAAQGLLRLSHVLSRTGCSAEGDRFRQAGLSLAKTLLTEPYLNTDPNHQGILLHVIYHRPRDWDHRPHGCSTPAGESALWGDYHLLELGLYLQRMMHGQPYYTFFD